MVKFGVLAKDTAIIVGSNTYPLAAVMTYFYKSGKLESGYLAKETAIIVGSNTYPFAVGKGLFASMRVARSNKQPYQRTQPSPLEAIPIPLLLVKRLTSILVASSNMDG